MAIIENGTPGAALLPPHITVYAFKNRFTSAERIAIRAAAATTGAVADFLDMCDSRPFIDLSDPTTVADVQALETATLIAAGRAAVITSLTITAAERAA